MIHLRNPRGSFPTTGAFEESLLDDGDGDMLTDFSGNGNHGTISGATWIDDVPQPPHSGPEWFVSEGGSDENNGSVDYPFATIQHAINSANDDESVFEEFGIFSKNFIWYRVLDGDKSDNISGVRGLGLKTIKKKLSFFN